MSGQGAMVETSDNKLLQMLPGPLKNPKKLKADFDTWTAKQPIPLEAAISTMMGSFQVNIYSKYRFFHYSKYSPNSRYSSLAYRSESAQHDLHDENHFASSSMRKLASWSFPGPGSQFCGDKL